MTHLYAGAEERREFGASSYKTQMTSSAIPASNYNDYQGCASGAVSAIAIIEGCLPPRRTGGAVASAPLRSPTHTARTKPSPQSHIAVPEFMCKTMGSSCGASPRVQQLPSLASAVPVIQPAYVEASWAARMQCTAQLSPRLRPASDELLQHLSVGPTASSPRCKGAAKVPRSPPYSDRAAVQAVRHGILSRRSLHASSSASPRSMPNGRSHSSHAPRSLKDAVLPAEPFIVSNRAAAAAQSFAGVHSAGWEEELPLRSGCSGRSGNVLGTPPSKLCATGDAMGVALSGNSLAMNEKWRWSVDKYSKVAEVCESPEQVMQRVEAGVRSLGTPSSTPRAHTDSDVWLWRTASHLSAKLADEVASLGDLTCTFSRIVREMLGTAVVARVFIVSDDRASLKHAVVDSKGHVVGQTQIPLGCGVTGILLMEPTLAPIFLPNGGAHVAYDRLVDDPFFDETAEISVSQAAQPPSLLSLPLVSTGKKLVGALSVAAPQEANLLANNKLDVLIALSSFLASAFRSAHRQHKQAQDLDRQDAFMKAMSAAMSPDSAFGDGEHSVAAAAARAFECDACTLWHLDTITGCLVPVATWSRHHAYSTHMTISMKGDSPLSTVTKMVKGVGAAALLIGDAAECEDYATRLGYPERPRSVLCTPLRDEQGRAVGVLELLDKQGSRMRRPTRIRQPWAAVVSQSFRSDRGTTCDDDAGKHDGRYFGGGNDGAGGGNGIINGGGSRDNGGGIGDRDDGGRSESVGGNNGGANSGGADGSDGGNSGDGESSGGEDGSLAVEVAHSVGRGGSFDDEDVAWATRFSQLVGKAVRYSWEGQT